MKAEPLLQNSDLTIPAHIAIIMDGNGRWAKARGLPRIAGHRRGADAVRSAIESAIKYGVRYLTLYSFSSENWKRPADEVNDLMGLLRRYLRSEIAELHQNGVRLRVIGERADLSKDIVDLIEDCEARTAGNTTLDLIIALSYGGRSEIVNAAKTLAEKSVAGDISPDDIDEALLEKNLDTSDIPDPDLLIRTSGEQRISNFLLWQLAYAEFVFLDTLWPDFKEPEFVSAISEFSRRERRYGATN
ncbi:MAG: isoprenyl transferase [Rhodospirillaceae bacterium]|jgi:undecaprenyl diphosphate synthase|nr:isoprenyl transferase [Rhodospirillaceae bacterium]MBT4589280.1 isoprenyl transferase [Rhodospirillaceae bacterium]MBT4940692.1 isoprenyl transferase [Rhodospirillaceae bacterium]MBT5938954.1 isoprenyl transferase [Rhodospirillaceae bacterium]